MKKSLRPILLFSFIVFCNIINAQLSHGGKPFSFSNNFQTIFQQNLKFENLRAFDLAALRIEDSINDHNQIKGPFRFGYNHYVNYNLNNSGVWIRLPNGDRLWLLALKSKGALAINLAFDDFFMPEGAKLFVYSADKSFVIGAFTNINNQKDKAFATEQLLGDAIVLEYYEPATIANQGRLNLFRVTHAYRGVKDYLIKDFGDAGSCQVNVNCPLGHDWQNQKNSVLLLIIGGNTICSGSLINDVPQDGKPYVLTANHCGSSGFNTCVFRFNWEAPGCINPASSPPSISLTGGVQRAADTASDMSLLEITGGLSGGLIPENYNVYFSGWSIIDTPATSAICIHHPSADIKKISQALNATLTDTFNNVQCWRVGQWTTGCTEPGSSGSPLYDQNKRIIGQLFGGPSGCGDSAIDMHDNYGKFANSWLGRGTESTQLKHWLDPNNTGVTTLDGIYSDSIPHGLISEITSFNIYPNPNNGNFNLAVNSNIVQNIPVKVYNMLGQLIYNNMLWNASSGIYNIDLNEVAGGMYFVEMSIANGRTVKRITVIR